MGIKIENLEKMRTAGYLVNNKTEVDQLLAWESVFLKFISQEDMNKPIQWFQLQEPTIDGKDGK